MSLTREEVERRLARLAKIIPKTDGGNVHLEEEREALQTALAAMAERDALAAENNRLRKTDNHTCLTCIHWGTSMSEYPCLECGQHYDRSDLWEPVGGEEDGN